MGFKNKVQTAFFVRRTSDVAYLSSVDWYNYIFIGRKVADKTFVVSFSVFDFFILHNSIKEAYYNWREFFNDIKSSKSKLKLETQLFLLYL